MTAGSWPRLCLNMHSPPSCRVKTFVARVLLTAFLGVLSGVSAGRSAAMQASAVAVATSSVLSHLSLVIAPTAAYQLAWPYVTLSRRLTCSPGISLPSFMLWCSHRVHSGLHLSGGALVLMRRLRGSHLPRLVQSAGVSRACTHIRSQPPNKASHSIELPTSAFDCCSRPFMHIPPQRSMILFAMPSCRVLPALLRCRLPCGPCQALGWHDL